MKVGSGIIAYLYSPDTDPRWKAFNGDWRYLYATSIDQTLRLHPRPLLY